MQKLKNQFSIAISLIIFLFISACDGTRVLNPNQYKKSSVQYGKVVKDRNQFVICTPNANRSSKKSAYALAKKECAKFGKRSVYKSYSIATCPLSTASSWHFSCVP